MEKKVVIISDKSPETFRNVIDLLEKGWEKDQSISYNPYGTETTRFLHLVKYDENERLPLEGEGEGPKPIVEDSIIVSLDKYDDRKRAEEQKTPTPYQTLMATGYVEGHKTSTTVVMEKYRAVPAPKEEPGPADRVLASLEKGITATEETTITHAAEPILQKATVEGETPVMEETQKMVNEVAPELLKPKEEAPPAPMFDRSDLGCAACMNDGDCTDIMCAGFNKVMKDYETAQCPAYNKASFKKLYNAYCGE